MQIPDAGEGELKSEDWTKSQGGRIIGLMARAPVGTPGLMAVVDVSTRKLKRTTHSSFDANGDASGSSESEAGIASCTCACTKLRFLYWNRKMSKIDESDQANQTASDGQKESSDAKD